MCIRDRRRDAVEEIMNELALQVAHAIDAQPQVHRRMRAATEIDRRHRQRLVHGHEEVPCPIDALAVAERLEGRRTEDDADVLDRVMLILSLIHISEPTRLLSISY